MFIYFRSNKNNNNKKNPLLISFKSIHQLRISLFRIKNVLKVDRDEWGFI